VKNMDMYGDAGKKSRRLTKQCTKHTRKVFLPQPPLP
jgi:hypothetical protein